MDLLAFFALLLVGHVCLAEHIAVTWNVTYVEHNNRVGHFFRRSIGVNGELPIPPVYIDHGDTLLLTVHNSLDQPTSIHAHGLFQRGQSFMDGAGMATECSIPPGESFTYTIHAHQSGTYWLHGHTQGQQADGLRAPFIIRDRYQLHSYDDEYLFSLEDWYPTESQEKMAEITAPGAKGPPPPSYPFGLINGYNANDTRPIRFAPGRRYRIRVISMSSTEYWKFSIPGHRLEVVEADGVLSEPHAVDALQLGPAQRYSVIVTARETDEFNFIYNCTLYADFVPLSAGQNPRIYTGLVEYRQDAPVKQLPAVGDDQLVWPDETKMHALDGEPELSVDRQIVLETRLFRTTDGRGLRKLGALPYMPPKVPTIFTAMTMGALAMDPRVYGPQAQAFVLPLNQSVEILLKNPSGQTHVQHSHGGTFQVIEFGPVAHSELEAPPTPLFTLDSVPAIPVRRAVGAPMRRDTVDVPPFTYARLRFRADNPGVWLHHCHISPAHSEAGLGVTFVVAPDVMQKTQTIPDSVIRLCKLQGIKTSGNAVGNWGLDLTGLPPVPVEAPTPPLSNNSTGAPK
ncbi:ferroxidase fet3 [Coemansia erecta]|nr:ferroxidase fet3 [Coemansia sp. RSA 2618]KAJ2829944.1 ferroxidase fet3 [Coemansia erecta]